MGPEVSRDASGRPIVDGAFRALCAALREAAGPELAAVKPDRVVFVAAAARRAARASIRPLTHGGHPPSFERAGWRKPQVWLGDRPALYEVALRPRYFLDATPEARVRIIAHELWHASPAFDGTLADGRRHLRGRAPPDDAAVDGWVDAWRRAGARQGELLAYRGELRVPAWTERPPSRLGPTGRRRYSQDDLHLAIVEQV